MKTSIYPLIGLILFVILFSCRKTNLQIGFLMELRGLLVTPGGELSLNGKPYRGVGVNYFNAFYRILLSPTARDTSYKAGFRYLKSQGIPFYQVLRRGLLAKRMESV